MRANLIFWSAALMLAIAPAQAHAASIGAWGIDLSDQDHSVRPGDDFYRYQNGAWIGRAAPDVKNPFMSYWRDVRNVAPARLRAILDGMVADPATANSEPLRKAATLYREYLDEGAIERRGNAPLQPELKAIRGLKTRSEIARYMGRMEGPQTLRGANMRDGYGRGMFVMNVSQDARRPERNALYLGQGGLMLPDRLIIRPRRSRTFAPNIVLTSSKSSLSSAGHSLPRGPMKSWRSRPRSPRRARRSSSWWILPGPITR